MVVRIPNLVEGIHLGMRNTRAIKTSDIVNGYIGHLYLYTLTLVIYPAYALLMIQIEIDKIPSKIERAPKSEG
jgi:hypothetical protein